MFIVIPFLSKDPSIFGIYSICISLGIFLNYADLGFLKSTKKYAAEFYARNDRTNEMKFLGFGSFILMIFTLLLTIVIFWFSYNPDLLIKELHSNRTFKIASDLLLILAIFTPGTIFKRLIEMIFEIRLENFIVRRVFLFASLITIFSVFYFFGNNNYMIVEYFFFFKIIDFLAVLISFFIAKNKYSYDILKLFSYIKFDFSVYNKSYKLAYSGLYMMFSWVLFYEIDQIFIGKYLGSQKVAIYAIAFSFSIIFRQIFGIIFRPFVERSNHLIGLNDEKGLKKLIISLIIITCPLTVIPTFAFSLFSKSIILSWVGIEYYESINLAVFLSLNFSFAFITYPMDMFLLAKEKIKYLYVSATMLPLIYWIGIFVTISDLGVFSLGIFKFTGTVFVVSFYIYILIKSLNISYNFFFSKITFPLVIPLSIVFVASILLNNYLNFQVSKVNFIINLIITGMVILVSLFISYYTSREIKLIVRNIYNNFNKLK